MKKIGMLLLFLSVVAISGMSAQASNSREPVKAGERTKTCIDRAEKASRDTKDKGGSRKEASNAGERTLRDCVRNAPTARKEGN